MDYQNINIPADIFPFKRLLPKAFATAMNKLEYKGDYRFIFKLPSEYFIADFSNKCYFTKELEKNLLNYSLIDIDPAYLFGLITGIYHWNNAEVGSQFFVTRVPDVFNPNIQHFLNFFHV